MSKTNPNDSININRSTPVVGEYGDPRGEELSGGLTKREFFAAMAMQGILNRLPKAPEYEGDFEYVAKASNLQADALILELNKEK